MDQALDMPVQIDPTDFPAQVDLAANVDTATGLSAQTFTQGIPDTMDTSMTAPAIPDGISAGRKLCLNLYFERHLTSKYR